MKKDMGLLAKSWQKYSSNSILLLLFGTKIRIYIRVKPDCGCENVPNAKSSLLWFHITMKGKFIGEDLWFFGPNHVVVLEVQGGCSEQFIYFFKVAFLFPQIWSSRTYADSNDTRVCWTGVFSWVKKKDWNNFSTDFNMCDALSLIH